MREHEEFRGIINSAYAANGRVMRVVGDKHEPKSFSTFGPMAIAGIGSLPGTVEDRSIKIRLRMRLNGEEVVQLRMGKTEHLEALARQIARFISDHADELEEADPVMPSGLHDRMRDNWCALLAIADELDGEWPRRAREAAQLLAVESQELDEQASELMLLEDIRRIFETADTDRIQSSLLVERLLTFVDRPWLTNVQPRPTLECSNTGSSPADVWDCTHHNQNRS